MDDKDIELNILSLRYSRYISKAHTIFSTCIGIIMGGIVGLFGIVFAYSEVFEIKPDLFKLFYLGLHALGISVVITIVSFIIIHSSRIERQNIIEEIRKLKTTQPN